MATITPSEDLNSDSALLSLPAELRNRIYEYALTVQNKHGKVGEVAIERHPPAERSDGNGSVLRLLQTCRQIHQEARAIFYHENTLHLHPWEASSFIASLSHARLVHIRSVSMTVCFADITAPDTAWVKALLLLPSLRRLRLELTYRAVHCAFFGFIDEQLRQQLQIAFVEPPENTFRSTLLQLRDLTNLELRLSDICSATGIEEIHETYSKMLEAANKQIGGVVMKPEQDTESTPEAQESEKREANMVSGTVRPRPAANAGRICSLLSNHGPEPTEDEALCLAG